LPFVVGQPAVSMVLQPHIVYDLARGAPLLTMMFSRSETGTSEMRESGCAAAGEAAAGLEAAEIAGTGEPSSAHGRVAAQVIFFRNMSKPRSASNASERSA